MKKSKYYHYFIPIYDRNIYIYVYKNHNWVVKELKKFHGVKRTKETPGICYRLDGGDYVLVFKNEVLIDTLCHEITHIRQWILEECGFYDDNIMSCALAESEAYLEGHLMRELMLLLDKHVDQRTWRTITKKVNK